MVTPVTSNSTLLAAIEVASRDLNALPPSPAKVPGLRRVMLAQAQAQS